MEADECTATRYMTATPAMGKDNDGGQTIDAEVDPGDLTNSAYAGRGFCAMERYKRTADNWKLTKTAIPSPCRP